MSDTTALPNTTGPTTTGQLIGLDRILAVEPGRRAEAVCNVPSTLAIFDSHFPRFPVLPGVIVLGSLAKLAALLLRESTLQEWRLAEAQKVRFRQFVRPGDVMELIVELTECDGEQAVCTARAAVDGKRVTTIGRLLLVRADEAGAR
jgi:3-hydroxyacyl-[acyl-carrier-protein] dehydratase